MTTQSPRPLLGCIADDFTGATDLANMLVRGGMRTVQTIGVPSSDERVEADALVVALKSRTIPAADAVAQSLAALNWLRAQGCRQFFFKYCSTFDSTDAGNIGPVADALLDVLSGFDAGAGSTSAASASGAAGEGLDARDRAEVSYDRLSGVPRERSRTIYRGHLFVGLTCCSTSRAWRSHPLTPMTDANPRARLATADRIEGGARALHESVDAGCGHGA